MGRAEFESWGNERQPYLRPAACCLNLCVFSFHEASLRWRLSPVPEQARFSAHTFYQLAHSGAFLA